MQKQSFGLFYLHFIMSKKERLKLKSIYTLTVCLAGHCSIIRAVAGLHLPFSQLQLVRIRQLGPADVPYPLLLPRPSLGYIHRHPGRPRGVSSHLRARFQITSLVLL